MIILSCIEEIWHWYSIFKAVSKRFTASADLASGSRVVIGHMGVYHSFGDVAGLFD